MQSLRMGAAWLLSPTIRRDGQVEISRRLPGCQSASQCPAQRLCRSVLHIAAGLEGGRKLPPHTGALPGQPVSVHGRFSPQGQDADRARERPEPGLRAVRLRPSAGADPVDARVEREASRLQAQPRRAACRQAVPTRDLPVPPSMPRVAGVPARCTGAALSGAAFQLTHLVSLVCAEADGYGGCGAQTAKVVSRRISGDRR